eukprot:8653474-Pyramimonas_sp.AAC.1
MPLGPSVEPILGPQSARGACRGGRDEPHENPASGALGGVPLRGHETCEVRAAIGGGDACEPCP